ncbi:hypothetical protein BHE74_00048438 [Ensete ventricosum]|nr:hypothetical protein BHE74_00048438 [Ensete ventricosum]
MNEKVSRALETLKSLHDCESVVIEELLSHVRKRYSIPLDYELHAPRPGQRSHEPFSNGFSLTFDALKIGESGVASRGASQGEGSVVGSTCIKGRASLSGVDSSAKATRPVKFGRLWLEFEESKRLHKEL